MTMTPKRTFKGSIFTIRHIKLLLQTFPTKDLMVVTDVGRVLKSNVQNLFLETLYSV